MAKKRKIKIEDFSVISHDDMEVLREFIFEKDKQNILNIVKRIGPKIVANNVDDFTDDEFIFIAKVLNNDLRKDFFIYLDIAKIQVLIGILNKQTLRGLFDSLYKDDIINILEGVNQKTHDKLMKIMSTATKKAVKEITKYGEGTAGYEMNPDFIKFYETDTIENSIKKIKKKRMVIENNTVLFVVSKKGALVGHMHIKDLLLANHNRKLSTIINKTKLSVRPNISIEAAAHIIRKFNLSRLPIVSDSNILMGTLVSDDVISIIVDDVSEDISKLNAVGEVEDDYLKVSIFCLFKSRIFWLSFLMIVMSFTGNIMSLYESSISEKLMIFIPVIMATAGNSGGQASATVIRALAVGEVSSSDYWKVLWKELKASIVIASILFGFNIIRMLTIHQDSSFELGQILVISASLAIIVIISKLLGGVLPLIAKKVKLDPATMAGPIVTTTVDILAIMLVFSMYSWFIIQ